LVKLVGGGGLGRRWDYLVLEFALKVWPVGLGPRWLGFVIMGKGGIKGD